MAAGAVGASAGQVIATWPWLVKRWEGAASENETVVFTHGESSSPDIVIPMVHQANPTGSEVSLVSRTTSATTFTVDCEADSKVISVIAIWFAQGSGGLENVS
jgi:hypothetical protein